MDHAEIPPHHRFLFKSILDCQNGGCSIDVFLPEDEGIRSTKGSPIAIAIHGGAFTTGASSDVAFDQIRYLLSKGFTVCSPEYRLTPHAKQRDAHADVFDAFVFIRNALETALQDAGSAIRLDITRVIAFGGSAGGTAALRLASDIETYNAQQKDESGKLPSLRAVIPAYPCTDVADWCCKPTSALDQGLNQESSEVQEKIAQFYKSQMSVSLKNGSDPSEPRMLWVQKAFQYDCLNSFLFGNPPYPPESSFLNLVTPTLPPIFILMAEKDRLIPPKQSQQLHDALKAAGVECHMEIFKDADHGFTSGRAAHTWPEDGSYGRQIHKALDFAIDRASSSG